jgi:hypothetical protein
MFIYRPAWSRISCRATPPPADGLRLCEDGERGKGYALHLAHQLTDRPRAVVRTLRSPVCDGPERSPVRTDPAASSAAKRGVKGWTSKDWMDVYGPEFAGIGAKSRPPEPEVVGSSPTLRASRTATRLLRACCAVPVRASAPGEPLELPCWLPSWLPITSTSVDASGRPRTSSPRFGTFGNRSHPADTSRLACARPAQNDQSASRRTMTQPFAEPT